MCQLIAIQWDILVPIKCCPVAHYVKIKCYSEGGSYASGTLLCQQLNAIQWDIHVPIECYPEGGLCANYCNPAGHICANLMVSSGIFICQLNAIK